MKKPGFFPFSAVILPILVACLIIGCSQTGDEPVSPSQPENIEQPLLTAESNRVNISKPSLWGYYDLIFDFENQEVEVVPNRSMDYAINVVQFLNSTPAGVTVSNFQATQYSNFINTSMDITITHPMDDEKFNGYDVRGIFIGNGSGIMSYNPELNYPIAKPDKGEFQDQWLQNYDGFTRWFNPTEFTSPGIFGYTQGNLAPAGYTGTAKINPYKYFANNLDKTGSLVNYFIYWGSNAGVFAHGTNATRRYEIYFPKPVPGVKYGYAVMANWGGGPPQFHPSFCPEIVSVELSFDYLAWYVDETSNGGWVLLYPRIFDHGSSLTNGVMEDYTLYFESDMFSEAYKCTADDMTPVDSNNQFHRYRISIPADNLKFAGSHSIFLIAEYKDYDYTNPFGIPNAADTDPLTGILCFDYMVGDTIIEPYIEIIFPTDGAIFEVGKNMEIHFNVLAPGNLDIFYFKNDDIGSPIPIAANVVPYPSLSYFTWENIPNDPSDKVKILIRSTLDPDIYGVSDGYFSIVAPSIEVTSPNGGEIIETGKPFEITWTSGYLTGGVDILYSKDNFVSDEHTIADNVSNTGNWMWDVADDVSDTVRVKVRSHIDPDNVYDISDADFTIKQAVLGWAIQGPYPFEDIAYSIARNSLGDSYIAGLYAATHGRFSRTTETYIHWEKTLTPSTIPAGSKCVIYDIAIDGDDNLYLVGEFQGQVNFNPELSSILYKTSAGGSDAFMAKYDFDGNVLDVWTWGGTGNDGAMSISIDPSNGNIYVAGYFSGTDIDLDPTSGTSLRSSKGLKDCFLIAFDSTDSFLYSRAWGGTGNDVANGVTSNILVYVTGAFEGTVNLYPSGGSDVEVSNGMTDAFLSCFIATTGTYLWGHSWGGAGEDEGQSVAFDALSNCYVTGQIEDVDIDFNPDPGEQDIHDAFVIDAYLISFNSSGGYRFGFNWGNGFEKGRDVIVSENGYVYVTGQADRHLNDLDFDPGPGVYEVLGSGAFVSRFDTSGNFFWARVIGKDTAPKIAIGNGLAVGEDDSIYMAGAFSGADIEFAPIQFCSNDSFMLTSEGDYDLFAVKYRSDGCW